jgi:hypothetical protein
MRDYLRESRLHVLEHAANPGHARQCIGTAHHLGQRDLRQLLRTLDAGGQRHDMRPKRIGRDSLFQQGLHQGRHRGRQGTGQRGIHVRRRAQPGLSGVQATDHFTCLPGELHETAPYQTVLLRAENGSDR